MVVHSYTEWVALFFGASIRCSMADQGVL